MVEIQRQECASRRFLRSAARFARQSYEVEEAHQRETDEIQHKIALGQLSPPVPFNIYPFQEEICHCATGSVFFAAAALEAYVNELFSDIVDGRVDLGTIDTSLKGKNSDPLRGMLEGTNTSILDRYQEFLNFAGKPTMVKGVEPYQSVNILVSVRNALVHYRPEMQTVATQEIPGKNKKPQGKHGNLEKKLSPKITASRFFGKEYAFFPMRCMTHSLGAWAVTSAFRFADNFAKLSGVSNGFAEDKDLGFLRTTPHQNADATIVSGYTKHPLLVATFNGLQDHTLTDVERREMPNEYLIRFIWVSGVWTETGTAYKACISDVAGTVVVIDHVKMSDNTSLITGIFRIMPN